jgi:predicted N-acetyltransferase YhbS
MRQAIGNEIQIRNALVTDKDAVNSVQIKSLGPGHAYTYSGNIGVRDNVNLVATESGHVIGFISALTQAFVPDGINLWKSLRPYIGFVGVHPARQHKGTGSCLVRAACEAVFLNPCFDSVFLECEENLSGFYEPMGFERVDSEDIEHMHGIKPKACVYRLDRGSLV